MKNKKIIVLFSLALMSLPFLPKAEDSKCKVLFISPFAEIYQKVTKNRDEFITKYQGQKGFLLFIEEMQTIETTENVFTGVFYLLNKKEMKQLGWKMFVGKKEDLRAEILKMESAERNTISLSQQFLHYEEVTHIIRFITVVLGVELTVRFNNKNRTKKQFMSYEEAHRILKEVKINKSLLIQL